MPATVEATKSDGTSCPTRRVQQRFPDSISYCLAVSLSMALCSISWFQHGLDFPAVADPRELFIRDCFILSGIGQWF